MRRSLPVLAVVAILTAIFVPGFLALTKQAGATSPEPSKITSWPLTETERTASEALAVNMARMGLVFHPNGAISIDPEGEIARVTSGEAAAVRVANLVLAARAIGRSEGAVVREAERRLGVAVVQSGATWVARNR